MSLLRAIAKDRGEALPMFVLGIVRNEKTPFRRCYN